MPLSHLASEVQQIISKQKAGLTPILRITSTEDYLLNYSKSPQLFEKPAGRAPMQAMAHVEARAATLRWSPAARRRPQNPLRLLHEQVSFDHLSRRRWARATRAHQSHHSAGGFETG
jgi:hypothetical protein